MYLKQGIGILNVPAGFENKASSAKYVGPYFKDWTPDTVNYCSMSTIKTRSSIVTGCSRPLTIYEKWDYEKMPSVIFPVTQAFVIPGFTPNRKCLGIFLER